MGNYSARFGGRHMEKGSNAPRQVSTLQLYAFYGNTVGVGPILGIIGSSKEARRVPFSLSSGSHPRC